MPVLMAKAAIFGAVLIAAKFGADGAVDHLGQVVRDLKIGEQAEEYIAGLADCIPFPPDPAIAECGDGADAIIERDALFAVGFIGPPFARRFAQRDIAERQRVPVQQFRDLGRGQ